MKQSYRTSCIIINVNKERNKMSDGGNYPEVIKRLETQKLTRFQLELLVTKETDDEGFRLCRFEY